MKRLILVLALLVMAPAAVHAQAGEVAEDARALCDKGTALREARKYKEAVEVLARAVALDPRYDKAHNQLGLAYQALGRHEDAAESFRRAVRVRPYHAAAHKNLGLALYHLGRYDEAITELREAIRIMPAHSIEAQNFLGLAYARVGRHKEAADAFKEALRLRPNYTEARFFLGLTYAALGDKGAARGEQAILKGQNVNLARVLQSRIDDEDVAAPAGGGVQ